MLNFAAIADAFQKDEEQASVDNKTQPSMSVRAMEAVKRSIVSGMLKSFSIWIFNNVPDPKDQKAKFLTLLNAMIASGDVASTEAQWLVDYYERQKTLTVACDELAYDAPCTSSYLSWYTVMDDMLSDPQVYEWSFREGDTEESGKTGELNEHEALLVKTYKAAYRAYCEARDAFEKYFRDVNAAVFKQLLLKYGTTIGQVAPQWYKDVARCAGVLKDDTPPPSEG